MQCISGDLDGAVANIGQSKQLRNCGPNSFVAYAPTVQKVEDHLCRVGDGSHIVEYNRSRILVGVAKARTDIFSLQDEARHALSLFGIGSRFFIH